MKTVLIILTQANLSSLQVHESLSASMVLATFGCPIKVLLQEAALSLLHAELNFEPIKHAFKIASNMVDSFEFYDLSPILIEKKYSNHPFVRHAQQDIEFVQFDRNFIQSFDHVLYW